MLALSQTQKCKSRLQIGIGTATIQPKYKSNAFLLSNKNFSTNWEKEF